MPTDSRRPLLVLLAAALFIVAPPSSAHAQDAPEVDPEYEIGEDPIFGAGLGSGTFTSGLTGKLYLDQRSALQAFVGGFGAYGRYDFDCTFGCGFAISADYLYEFHDLVQEPGAGRLFLGGGGGGYIGWLSSDLFDDDIALGVNGVFELGWHFYQVPLELVIDVRPVLSITGFTPNFLDIDGGIAARYYF